MPDAADDNSKNRNDSPDQPTGGSGEGGAMGTPTKDAEEAPPSYDQEANEVVSGGGVVGPEDGKPSDAAH